MDVNLIHKLTIENSTTVIGEPQGFDDLEVSIERTDYHGISAEQSVGNLGFYGDAADIIEDAYNTDIDTVIVYSAETQEGNVIYSGVVDLSTYQQKVGDYRLVTCKVGEIGVKTTFNNRSEVEVDLNTDKSIDGYNLAHNPLWKAINVPRKHLLYTNLSKQRYDVEYTAYYGQSTQSLILEGLLQFVSYPITSSDVVEFGEFAQNTLQKRNDSGFAPQYTPKSDHEELFGTGTVMDIDSELDIEIYVNSYSILGGVYYNPQFKLMIDVNDMGSGSRSLMHYDIQKSELDDSISTGNPISIKLHSYARNIPANQSVKFYLEYSSIGVRNLDFTLKIKKDTQIRMTMFDNLPDETTLVEMLPIHEALNKITEAISDNQLTVKSDWYGHIGSIVNAPTTIGGGALKAITNGYKMRDLKPDSDEERNMPLSFKDIIKSLQALDCIGWGFSRENGTDYLRVEPRSWFYKNDVLLSISGAKEVTRKVDPDKIITSLTIGYKKYSTNEDYNSIDNVHSERTFVSGIKAVSKEVESLCEFIADNYAIEETRRARTNVKEHEEFKYDENIFVFEFVENREGALSGEDGVWSIICTAVLDDEDYPIIGINRPSELINAKLSPRRMAERWRSQGALFMTNANASGMDFSSGTVNYKASYTDRPTHSGNIYSLDAQSCVAEDENIADNRSPQIAETIELEFPITRAQFAAIKANPYGLIVANGDPCWIKKVQYSVITGKTKFTLIPKN